MVSNNLLRSSLFVVASALGVACGGSGASGTPGTDQPSTAGAASNPTQQSNEALSCGATNWTPGKSYAVGDVVFYDSKYYVANHANPGYSPTVSTWYWSPKSGCSSTTPAPTTTPTTSTGSSAFERIVSRATFESIFPGHDAFYTYDGLVTAAKLYPAFASTGTIDQQKQEVAAFLANVTHETGGLVYIEEIKKGPYCSTSSTCPCAAGQQYYGRGPLQLSWNDNYCSASQAIFGDPNTLRTDPGRVAREAWVAWGTGLWFWMTEKGSGSVTAHDAMVTNAGFGQTIRTINGAVECNGGYTAGVTSRVNAYNRICGLLGVSPGANLTC